MQGNGGRSLTSIPLALGGIVAGHALAYALAYPIGALRDAHLEQTGHEGFPVLLLGGIFGAGAAIVWLGVRSVRTSIGSPRATSLLALQVPAFAMLELVERGFDVAALAHDPAVLVGLLLQIVLAVAIATIARGAVAVGTLLGRVAPRSHAAPPSIVPPRLAETTTPDPIAFGFRRAPPTPSPV